MSENIVSQIVDKLKKVKTFALQLDECTEHILFCKSMQTSTTGEEIFKVIDHFLSHHDLSWNVCKYECTDGVSAMTGRVNGLVARIRKENPSVQWVHDIIHREVLASEKMRCELNEVLNESVKVVNLIKTRPRNPCLFHVLCEELGAEHHQLLLQMAFERKSATETV
ncbi:ZBED5 protein, partial [Polyodon spathula]|nr:ZBED5 protein [Polyodon spathula]